MKLPPLNSFDHEFSLESIYIEFSYETLDLIEKDSGKLLAWTH